MKKTTLFILGLIGAVFIGTLFNNCSGVEFSSLEDTNSVLGDVTVVEIIKTCDQVASTSSLKTFQASINFADTKVESGRQKVCPYKPGQATDDLPDASGNYTEKNNYLRARYEQYKTVSLPANAVVCGVEVSAPEQVFQYDDMIYLTYNDYILASSLNRSLATSESLFYDDIGGGMTLYKYNWDDVANTDFAGVNETADDYCAGSDNGYGACDWPLSQQLGSITMNYNPEVLVPISALSNNQKFGFIVTGDDDPDSDCYHENLDLDVKFYYFERQ